LELHRTCSFKIHRLEPIYLPFTALTVQHFELGNLIAKFGLLMISALNKLLVLRNQLLKERFTSSLRRGSLPARRKYASFQSATAAGVMVESGIASIRFRHAIKPPLR